jgi:hypothetical protein
MASDALKHVGVLLLCWYIQCWSGGHEIATYCVHDFEWREHGTVLVTKDAKGNVDEQFGLNAACRVSRQKMGGPPYPEAKADGE